MLPALILLGLAATVCTALVKAEDAQKRSPVVRTVSFSSSSGGGSLTWLPHRPGASRVIMDRHVVQTSGTSAATSSGQGASADSLSRLIPEAPEKSPSPGAGQSSGSDPFQDPFGDSKAASQTPTKAGPPIQSAAAQPGRPAEPLSDKVLQRQAAPSPLPWSLPQLPGGDPLAPRAKAAPGMEGVPGFDQAMAAKPPEETCPTYEQLNLKPIRQLTNDIRAKGDKFPFECPLKDQKYQPRDWPVLTFTWKASGLCHKPLYFEQAHLERYGHTVGPVAQPFVSAAHFFLTVPVLPYYMGVYPPNECIYTLGYYRPGSCAPWIVDPFPLSVRGALFEAAAWTGAAFIIP